MSSVKTAEAEERMLDYDVFEHLGSGASGEVFRVVNKTNNIPYVLKKMSLASMSDADQLRVKQEIVVMDNVNHPNVVKFRESFCDPSDNSVAIIMEHCEFGTLEDLIERQRYEGRPFPMDVLLEWMAELLCGLAHIHSLNILHRDLKTSNIFVTATNHLKLGDFGVCTILHNADAKAQSMIGTPYYFAPEVCSNEPYDVRSDVWSLGVVFYEMCALRRPFEAKNWFLLMQRIIGQEIEPFKNGIDDALEGIVRQMLNKDPSCRPTAQELLDVHFEVPLHHPSHPSQKPSNGRLLQKTRYLQLHYTKEWPPREERVVEDDNSTSAVEWMQTGVPLDFDAPFSPIKETPPRAEAKKIATTAVRPCKVSSGTLSRSPAAVAKPRVSKTVKKKVSSKKGAETVATTTKAAASATASSSPNSISRRKIAGETKGKSPPQTANLSLSSFTMQDLQQDVQQRRLNMFGEEAVPCTEDIPIVIVLPQGLTGDEKRPSHDSRSAWEGSFQCGGNSSSLAEAGSFLADVAAVLDRHTLCGSKIDPEALDAAVDLLWQYKSITNGVR